MARTPALRTWFGRAAIACALTVLPMEVFRQQWTFSATTTRARLVVPAVGTFELRVQSLWMRDHSLLTLQPPGSEARVVFWIVDHPGLDALVPMEGGVTVSDHGRSFASLRTTEATALWEDGACQHLLRDGPPTRREAPSLLPSWIAPTELTLLFSGIAAGTLWLLAARRNAVDRNR